MNKKRIVLIAAWFLLVVCLVMMFTGCRGWQHQRHFHSYPLEEIVPLNKHFACSGCSKCKQVLWAYKSPTIKEIIGEKDFN